MEANKFLHNTFYSDYIDIDPFGSPVKFIDSSLQKLNKNGFLAVTATDTASITGSSKTASMRRYGSHIFNCENKKELSLRVLATHIIKQAAKLDLKLTPIISYTVKHYARIYFKSEPGKKKVDKHLEKINSFYFCNKCRNYSIELNKCNTCQNELMSFGPLYSEKLSDIKLIKIMLSEFELLKKEINNLNFQKEIEFILNNQIEYNSVNLPFGYSISKIIKYKNINFELNKPDGRTPKLDDIINLIKEKGYDAYCVDKKYLLIKTNMPFKEFYELF
ncbi:hypothetical protein HOK68_00060 [Candidatus Woesearchaeota archaeon]|nr:hypothetical protein [Candidatus Woesearchaeota archaeon]